MSHSNRPRSRFVEHIGVSITRSLRSVSPALARGFHHSLLSVIVAFVGLAVLASASIWVHGGAAGVGFDLAVSFTKIFAARTAGESVTNAVPGPSARSATAASGRTQPLTSTGQTPDGLAASEWASIRAAYEAGRHAVQPAVAGGHQARNPGQQWRTHFDGRGFLVQPDAAVWQWGLELSAYGFPGHERALASAAAAPQVDADGSRLTYAWDAGLREWFVNDARGLEHGFTINERPAGGDAETGRRGDGEMERTDPHAASPTLLFQLAVRGTLRPVVERDGHGVRFVDAKAATVVNYTGLKVWDADGKLLSARFELVAPTPISNPQSAIINLAVDERGARYPLTIDPIAQQAYLKPAAVGTTQVDDVFGFSVAVSGDTVVVGAHREDSSTTSVNSTPNESASSAGAAYVFTRSAGVWTQQAYLKPAAVGITQVGDQFGFSVAVSGDTLVVGANLEDSSTMGVNTTPNESAGDSGAAYVFTRSAGVWTQQAYLKPAAVGTTQASDSFGWSVAVAGDTVVIGASFEDSSTTGVNSTPDESASGSGAAYVFTRGAGVWTQQAYLKPAAVGTSQVNDHFGGSVAVAGDTVVVGAFGEDSSTTGVNSTPNDDGTANNSGAAYVFTRSAGVWTEQAYLKPAAVGTTQTNDNFGQSVAVAGDTVVVGADREDSSTTGVNSTPDESAFNSGAAYVFTGAGPSAADGVVSGSLTTSNGTPIEGAVVWLSGTHQRKTITDASGRYYFDNVETNGFYTVRPERANYNFNPFTRSFSQLGNHTEAAFAGSFTGDHANPLDTAEYFVRQQYVDLLGREPDEGGFNYWSDEILRCGNDAACVQARRRDIAAAFFIEQEFQQGGSFIYGLYKGSLGRRPVYGEYAADRKQVVGGPNLDADKVAFANSFVQRAEFVQKYQGNTTPESFVDALLETVWESSKVDLANERGLLLAIYQTGSDTNQSRARVLQHVIVAPEFKEAEYNAAFVLTEYFGYLRRDPEPEGYDFWLNVLNNREPGNFRGMVCSFITSTEYQRRFSSVVSHSNAECGR